MYLPSSLPLLGNPDALLLTFGKVQKPLGLPRQKKGSWTKSGPTSLISHLPRWPHTGRFSEPTFPASEATKDVTYIEAIVIRDVSTFLRTFMFFLDLLSSDFSLL